MKISIIYSMKKFLVLILIFSGSIVFASNDEDSIWKRVAPNNYIYEDGIMGTTNMYGFSFLLKSFNKGQYEPINGRQILYTLNQYEINCAKRTYKIGFMDSYDDEGDFISGDYNKYATFQPIVEGTAVYEVSKKLCRPN